MDASFPKSSLQGNLFSERSWGIFLALAFHAALFIAGSLGLTHQAEYGMDFSNGASEVDLVAAPAPMAAASVSTRETAETPRAAPPVEDKEDVAEPAETPAPPAPPVANPAPNAVLRTSDLSGALGDGSSPVAGTDATTLHRAGTSGSYFKAGYYRNPPPPYPAEARRLKQEGRALLQVTVSAEGKVTASSLKQSSGFPLLDEAALKAVQNWRFKPATAGGLRVESSVEIPIRFQLKS